MWAASRTVLCVLALSVTVTAVSVADASASAVGARRCSVPKYPGSGYFISLTVSGTSCAAGKQLTIAYYRCRVRAGGIKGRCRARVRGFGCREQRTQIPTEIDARVTCRKRGQTVVHVYQQDT